MYSLQVLVMSIVLFFIHSADVCIAPKPSSIPMHTSNQLVRNVHVFAVGCSRLAFTIADQLLDSNYYFETTVDSAPFYFISYFKDKFFGIFLCARNLC